MGVTLLEPSELLKQLIEFVMSPFEKFKSVVLSLDLENGLQGWPESLLMRREGDWAAYYAPFDHVNQQARLVLVGITPGLQQAGNALSELQRSLRAGVEDARALEAAKKFASFSGRMRQNLVELLDHVGISKWLSIDTTAGLFSDGSDLVHYTSALRYPVTFKGKNYGGSPSIVRSCFTQAELLWLEEEISRISDAVFVPLGPAATEALELFVRKGTLAARRVLEGVPHPSPANAERIAYFLGRKPRNDLSAKTDAGKLDRAREQLIAAVGALPS